MKFAPTYQLASYLLSVMIIGVAFCMSPVYAQTDSLQLSPQLKIDSSHIDVRTFDPEMIEAYRSQNAFDYSKTVPDLNWIERILKSIIGFPGKKQQGYQYHRKNHHLPGFRNRPHYLHSKYYQVKAFLYLSKKQQGSGPRF